MLFTILLFVIVTNHVVAFPGWYLDPPILIWGARFVVDEKALDIWVHSQTILTSYLRVRLVPGITSSPPPDVLYIQVDGTTTPCNKQPMALPFIAVKYRCKVDSQSSSIQFLGHEFTADNPVLGTPRPVLVSPPPPPRSTKKISICVGGIDDAGLEFVDDFVSYHMNVVGVDHIVLGVSNVTKARDSLSSSSSVTLFDMTIPKEFDYFHRGSWKLHFYDWCLSYLKSSTRTTHVGVWDLDEYFVTKDNQTIDLSDVNQPGCGVAYPLREVYAPPYYLNETKSPRKRFPNRYDEPAEFGSVRKSITMLRYVEGAYFHHFIFANQSRCEEQCKSGDTMHHFVNLFNERVREKPHARVLRAALHD
jgi:hypothetical protein